jgi:MFS family permease
VRRFLNWFPMGLTYALLYMGRYNLTVAKTSLGKTQLMTKEDFGLIFGAGTIVYAIAFLVNGPLVDRLGGRKGMLISSFGAASANIAMGLYLRHVLSTGATDPSIAAHVQRALRREHVLPELRRGLHREGQRALVPRDRARRLLRASSAR